MEMGLARCKLQQKQRQNEKIYVLRVHLTLYTRADGSLCDIVKKINDTQGDMR